jgi:hypothetical protein
MAALCLVLAINAGCYDYVVWLPDSSGFIYTTDTRQLVRYDVATGRRQVLVADMGTMTVLPALSPDGKRIAVARLSGKSPGPDTLELTFYDLDGKELQRSPRTVWRRQGLYVEEAAAYTALLWGPKGKEDKVAVFEASGAASDWGLYDLKTKRLVVFTHQLFSYGPDAGGFVVANARNWDPKSIAFVDWDGKKHPITMKELDKESLEKDGIGLGLPTVVVPSGIPLADLLGKWEGTTFIGTLSEYRVRIDTEKRVGVFGQHPADKVTAKKPAVSDEYAFPEGGATVRVLWPEPLDAYRQLEVVKPGHKKGQVIVRRTMQVISLTPSPNKKLLVVRVSKTGNFPDRILLLNRDGKLVKEIVETDE